MKHSRSNAESVKEALLLIIALIPMLFAVSVLCILLAGCLPMPDPIQPFESPQRLVVISSETAAVQSALRYWEQRYIETGRPHPGAVRVRVVRALDRSPAVLPETFPDGSPTAAPGARAGTWASDGRIDVADPSFLPHELLHSAMLGQEHGPPWHREIWWSGWLEDPMLNPVNVP